MNSRSKSISWPLLLVIGMLLCGSLVLPILLPVRSQEGKEIGFGQRSRQSKDRGTKNREEQEHEEDEDKPDQPDEAAKFRRMQMQDENGLIPPDGYEKARQHVRLMRFAQAESIKTKRQDPKVAGIEPDSWEWLGPGNIGGRIRSIVIHPINTNRMWVGSVSGGIWRTTNSGTSWAPVDDFMANLAVTTIVINPANTNEMYAGTGEGFGNIDSIRGAGVFRSTDGGVTWDQLASTSGPVNGPDWFFVNRLAISPNGSTLLAATNTGIWRSTDDGAMWNPEQANVCWDIDFHPSNNSLAIAGGAGVARYSNDGGDTWTAATFKINASDPNPVLLNGGRVEVAYAPGTPSTVYASVNLNDGEIYKSTDGGQNYSRVNTGNNFFLGSNNQGWYDNVIWVNPQNSNFVIVGGIHLWRSTDGGTTLTRISDGSNSAHADHHVIVAHPAFNSTTNPKVFFGNDGGIYRTDNITTASDSSGWIELNNNLGITQFYGAAGNSDGVIIGGTQDNGTLRYNGSTETWTRPLGADGGYCAADLTNSNYFYGETQNFGLRRSTDGAQSFAQIYCDPDHFILDGMGNSTGKCQNGWGITDVNNLSNFIAPFILDLNNANRLLAGGRSLWRSTNVKAAIPTWTAIKNPSPANVNISAIAVAPGNQSIIWVGHNNGDVFRTTNGTAANPTWTQVDTNPTGLPNRFVTSLTISSSNSNIVYVTLGGFVGDNVYRTTDAGNTWTEITGTGATGLPDVPVRALVISPIVSNYLYVGTEVGIFASEDNGATWGLPQDGPANVSVDQLFCLGGDLIAATHGRGIYRASFGIYVDRNYLGVELGTLIQPFNTVTEGVNAVTKYLPIWIKPGNYNEPMTINKRLELRSLGGTVNIGKP